MTVRVYERISSEDQSVQSQRHEITKWLKTQQGGATAEWYKDEGYSRETTARRPDWQRLVKDLRTGDLVVFYSLDRSVVGLLDYLKMRQTFRTKKIGYQFIREGLAWNPGEPPDPFKETLEEMLAIFGKLETRIRQARQRAGIDAARARNNGTCPWGGRKAGTRVKVTPEREQTIRDLVAAGKPIAQIARVVGLTRRTVYRVLGRDTAK